MASMVLVSVGGVGLCFAMAYLMDAVAARIFRLPDAGAFTAPATLMSDGHAELTGSQQLV